MKALKPLLISFSLLAFAGASAYAAGDAKEKSASQAASGASSAAKKEDFSRLDKDGDGFIGRIEAAADADAKSRFEQLDQNGDQKLSRQEYQAWGGASAAGSASAGGSGKFGQAQGQMATSELIGKQVSDSQGKELGEIKDVVLDLQSGKVHAVVLEFGGFMGVGEKNFAFPISQLKPGKQQGQLTMNIDKQKLKNAEGFAQGQWPAMDDEYWGRVGGQASAGQTRSQGGKHNMTLVRASELEGKNVQDKSGQDVGEIKGAMVDMKSGQLRDIVVDVNDGGQTRVPAKALTKGTGEQYVLNMSAEQIRSQAKKSGKQAQSTQGQGASTGGTGDPQLPRSGGK